jgi:hypothetical protein
MNVFPAPPLLFAKHMPALLFFVYEKDRKEERKRIHRVSADSKSSIQSAYNFGFKEEKTRSAEWEKEKRKSGVA